MRTELTKVYGFIALWAIRHSFRGWLIYLETTKDSTFIKYFNELPAKIQYFQRQRLFERVSRDPRVGVWSVTRVGSPIQCEMCSETGPRYRASLTALLLDLLSRTSSRAPQISKHTVPPFNSKRMVSNFLHQFIGVKVLAVRRGWSAEDTTGLDLNLIPSTTPRSSPRPPRPTACT